MIGGHEKCQAHVLNFIFNLKLKTANAEKKDNSVTQLSIQKAKLKDYGKTLRCE